MSSDTDKFQAGETYAEVRDGASSDFFDNPVKVATELLRDCKGLRKEASLAEIVGLIKELTVNKGKPLDDRKG